MEWIVRVNTKTGKILKEKASQEEMRWGGRHLGKDQEETDWEDG